MPLGTLTRELIKATVMGEDEGVLGACVINNTPVVTHLVDNDCLLIPYIRATLRVVDTSDLGKVLKDRNLRGVEGIVYEHVTTIRVGNVRHVIKVINAAALCDTVTTSMLSEDYVTFNWYYRGYRFLRIVKLLKGVENLDKATSSLMSRLPFVKYTRVADGSIEDALLRRIIFGTIMSYFPGFSHSGFMYLCSNGVVTSSAEGEDCVLIQFEKRITSGDAFFDIINEFGLIGVGVNVPAAEGVGAHPVTVKLQSAYGDAVAYALVMRRSVRDTVLVSTPSLRRLIREVTNAIEGVQVSELLNESGLA